MEEMNCVFLMILTPYSISQKIKQKYFFIMIQPILGKKCKSTMFLGKFH